MKVMIKPKGDAVLRNHQNGYKQITSATRVNYDSTFRRRVKSGDAELVEKKDKAPVSQDKPKLSLPVQKSNSDKSDHSKPNPESKV